MRDIEFLRQLGEDLKAAALEEASGERYLQSGRSRRWFRRRVTAFLALVTLAVAALLWWTFGNDRGPAKTGSQIVQNGRGGGRVTGSSLGPIDAISPDDIWVGAGTFSGNGQGQHFLLHWDGHTWKAMDSPPIGLFTVASPNDIWGIGGDIGQEKIFHWDGTTWSEVVHHDPRDAEFTGIDAVSADDVWLVGRQDGAQYAPDSVGTNTLIEHWDGEEWSVLPSPNPSTRSNFLEGVVALSRSNVWAVGYSEDTAKPGTLPRDRSMTLHWDGQRWSLVPSPNPGRINVLWGCGPDGSGGVWAVGHDGLVGGSSSLSVLYMYWDGKAWRLEPPAPGGRSDQTATAVAGSSANDVWAVGDDPYGSLLIWHWDGSAWKPVEGERPPGSEQQLLSMRDVAALSLADAWAVGYYQVTTREGTLSVIHYHPVLEHWDGDHWRLVSLPAFVTP